jgi:hypothetical protein
LPTNSRCCSTIMHLRNWRRICEQTQQILRLASTEAKRHIFVQRQAATAAIV